MYWIQTHNNGYRLYLQQEPLALLYLCVETQIGNGSVCMPTIFSALLFKLCARQNQHYDSMPCEFRPCTKEEHSVFVQSTPELC